MEKVIYQLRKQLKIYKINRKLKLWARVPITVSSCPSSNHMYRRNLKTINPSRVSISRKNSRVKKRTNRNIQ